MKYSIIIATYNRLGEVKELLESAEKMDFDRAAFEIIFSDDGSTDDTATFLKDYQSASTLKIRYIFQQNKGPGEARNHGMREAKGEYFIYIDSDCLIPPDYLQKIDAGVKQDALDAFGGPDTYHESFSPLLKAINYSMTSFIGTGGTRGSKKAVTKFYPRSFNMGISREVYEKVGGMGGLRHGQDMEYSSRIYNNGFKVGLIPDAFVYHKRRTSLKRFFKQIFNWGVARINLGRLDKAMLKPIHFAPAVVVLGLILLLLITPFFGFTSWLWQLVGVGMIAVAVVAFVQSFMKYHSVKAAFLSIITLYIQVFAYGAGLLSGLYQSLKGGTAKGFTKNYYK